jgi:hypothetical protein
VALLALLAALVGLSLFAVVGGGEELSPKEQLRAERGENPVELTIAASGDLLIHSPLWAQALANGGGSSYDFSPMLAPLRPYVEEADIALCHVETPLSEDEPMTYPLFRAPAELATDVKRTGFDACDTASNHSLDQHQEGIDETVRILDRAGVPHTGSFASRAQSEQPLLLESGGVKIGFVAFTDYTNGIPLPHPWSVNVAEDESQLDRVIADAKAAREAGAEAVIVNMHWGTENSSEPDADQEAQAEALTDSKYVTAVVGQGPHVVQPIDRINEKFVVYSEGNLISNEDVNCCPAAAQDGMIVLLDLVIDGVGAHVDRVRYVPVWVDHSDYSVLPVGDAMKSGEADSASLRDSYERTTDVAGSGGGVVPVPPKL